MTLSIIIPVYNVASYLRECINSVLSQTFTDLEVICIDDGSTDGSGAVLDEYAAQDLRFRIVHRENQGVSVARQIGLEMAKGKYIGFVDPDDWIEPEMYSTLVHAAESSGADYVWENFSRDSARGVGERKDTVICGDCYELMDSLLLGKSLASLCVRLFRLEFVREHRIRFLSGRIRVCEDLCFICEVLAQHPKVLHVNCAHYHYRDVAGSITHSMNIGTIESWKQVCGRLKYVLHRTPSEESLMIFMRCCRLSAFMNKYVSDEYFYDFLPEVQSSKGVAVSPMRRILFWFAVHGMRGGVMKLAGGIRWIKALLGMRTQI